MSTIDFARWRVYEGMPSPNGKSLLHNILGIYEKQAVSAIQEMKFFAREKNWQLISETAHSLKSSSANVGAVQVSTKCAELEKQAAAANNGESPESLKLIQHLEGLIEESIRVIATHKSQE